MDKIQFGTGGWRAIIGKDFVCENIRRVAQGIYLLMVEQERADKPVIVGYDRRFLSETAAKWVAEVLTKNGVTVWLMQRSAPTPLIMHTVKRENLWFGIEITASHNPATYNGIKLFTYEGRDASVEVTQRLEELIASVSDVEYSDYEQSKAQGLVKLLDNPFNNFLDDILELLDVKALRKRGLRVLFDSMHGSGTYPLLVIFHTARCTIDTINTNKDAYFGGVMPAPSEKSLFALKNSVLNGKYDLGIAMDGDGDRLGIIDSNGKYINANETLCLLYYYLVKYKGWKGPVVRNIATTHMLDRIAESFGEKCYEVPVGFKYISSKLDEVDAVLGGESSGGLTVRGHIHGKDSVYAASLFAEMVSVTGKTPSQMLAELQKEFGKFVMVEDDMSFDPSMKSAVQKILLEDKRLPEFSDEITKVSYEDGCKVYFEDGFVICRFSGTEPLLRIFAESTSAVRAKDYINTIKKFVFE